MSYLIHALHSVEEPFFSIPIFSLVCLEKLLQTLFGDDKKSTLGSCFSVLVIPNLSLRTDLLLPHMLGLDIISCLHKHVFVVFVSYSSFNIKNEKNEKIKIGGEDAEFYFFF
jgi:hypothetical protein